MTRISFVTLENEMDLVLAYKKSILVAEACKHTIATQTTFATAVSEVARELIDKSNTGKLSFLIQNKEGKHLLLAKLDFDKETEFTQTTQGFLYASRLLPEATFTEDEHSKTILLGLKIPLSSAMTTVKVKQIEDHFKKLAPLTPYEEVKNRNQELYFQFLSKDENLKHSLYINERKDEFIAMAGHELKTPLTLVKAYAQILLQLNREDFQTQGSDFAGKIEQQASRMQLLIQQLLDISHIGNGSFLYQKAVIPFRNFIEEVYGMVKHLSPKHHIILNVDDNIEGSVYIDRLRLEQVITNLSGNATKYSEPGTTVTIHCSSGPDGIVIQLKDEGIGISEENTKRIFDKFYRVEEVVQKYSGLGIGLFITCNILRAHNSELKVESELKKGTTFYFVLAKHEDDSAY